MHRGNKYVASLFVSAALLAPMGAFAMRASGRSRAARAGRGKNVAYTIRITRTITGGISAKMRLTGTGWKRAMQDTLITSASSTEISGPTGTGATSTKREHEHMEHQ